jgi:hypothetical protein
MLRESSVPWTFRVCFYSLELNFRSILTALPRHSVYIHSTHQSSISLPRPLISKDTSLSMPWNVLFYQTRPQRQWDALLTCVITSLVLNACLHHTLSPFRSHTYFIAYVCAGRACISVIWLKLYQWSTGERGLDPFLNIGITCLAPMLAERWWWA